MAPPRPAPQSSPARSGSVSGELPFSPKGAVPAPAAAVDLQRPVISMQRFARMTGLSLKMRFLVAMTLLALAPALLLVVLYGQQSNQGGATLASRQGLLAPQNIPLIFLALIVAITLVATAVAFPIVRPIRRSTREILATTDDVQLLSEQAKQIAKDQRLGTDILEAAAKGLDLRRQAIERDAKLISSALTGAATRLSQLAVMGQTLPDSYQVTMQPLVREMYQQLQDAHRLASGIANQLQNDPVQKRLGSVMEGAQEISQQFEQASKELQQGARRLEQAAETLQ